MARDEWWVIEGVPRPIYVYGEGVYKRRHTVFIIVSVIGLVMAYFINVFSSELALLALTILIFSQIIEGVISFYKRSPGKIEESIVRNLVKLLGNKIIVWSIPTRYIISAIKIRGGVLIYTFMDKGRVMILVIKPSVFIGIVARKYDIVRVKKVRKACKEVVEEIEAIAPCPDNPRIWYKIVGRGVVVDASKTDLEEIISTTNKL